MRLWQKKERPAGVANIADAELCREGLTWAVCVCVPGHKSGTFFPTLIMEETSKGEG